VVLEWSGATTQSQTVVGNTLNVKMKTVISFCVLTVLTVGSPLAQTTFQKTFGGSVGDIGYGVQQTTDGGYIIAGETSNFGAGDKDVYLIRTTATGDTLWVKAYGGANDDIAYSVVETYNGGFIIAGATYSFGAGSVDVYLILTDANGDIIWTKTYGGNGLDWGYSVHQATDGGYVVLGQTQSFGQGFYDIYLIRTDSFGDTLWTKTYGGSLNENAKSMTLTEDGGYIITGFTGSYGIGSTDVYVIKTDSMGDTLWTRTYGGTNQDVGYSVKNATDGGYIILGETQSFGAGSSDIYMIKIDSLGAMEWSKTFGGTGIDQGRSVILTNDSSYIIAGNTRSFGPGDRDIYLIKTNLMGDTIWSKTLRGNGSEDAFQVFQSSDGGYCLVGYTYSFGAGGSDLYLIKTDTSGYSGGCNEFNPNTLVTTSPATIESSTSTIIGSGATITIPATATNNTTTLDSTLCYFNTCNLSSAFTSWTNVSCAGFCDGTASIISGGGTPPFSFTWSPSIDTTNIATNLCTGTHTVITTDLNGCKDTNEVVISEPDSLQVSLAITDVSCYGYTDGCVTSVNVTGGTPLYTYNWSLGPDPILPYCNLSAGTSISVLITDINGCTDSTSATIGEPISLSDSAAIEICAGDSILLGGAYQNTSGIYYDTLVSVNGCDSVIETTLDVAICNGVSDMSSIHPMHIYPNPNSGEFTIEFNTKHLESCELRVYSSLGQIVLVEKFKLGISNRRHIDLRHHRAGIYDVQVINSDGVMIRKSIIIY